MSPVKMKETWFQKGRNVYIEKKKTRFFFTPKKFGTAETPQRFEKKPTTTDPTEIWRKSMSPKGSIGLGKGIQSKRPQIYGHFFL